MSDNTGGPAYPQNTVYMAANGATRQQGPQGGMSLRDYFAAKAMQGILAGTHPIVKETDPLPTVAKVAYAQADAMLKARN